MAEDIERKSFEFSKRVGRALASHVEVQLAFIGDKLGLFKDLATNGPGTSEELANRNKVNGRYMREWLDGMVAAKYLTFDSLSSSYSLPPEHIPVLAKEWGPVFLGGTMNMVGEAGAVMPQVIHAFKYGGGVPYSAYSPEFWQGLERHTGINYENFLENWICKMDSSVHITLTRGSVNVCDVGCGRGRALIKLAKLYPKATFTGYDILPHAIQDANESAKLAGLNNISFFQIDSNFEKLPSKELFDIIFVFDVVHDLADPLSFLKSIRLSLKNTGIFECVDIKCEERAERNAVFGYGMSLFYCLTTCLHQKGIGLGTAGLTEKVMRDFCEKAGFTGGVKRINIQHPYNIVWEVRPCINSKL